MYIIRNFNVDNSRIALITLVKKEQYKLIQKYQQLKYT